MAKKQITIEDLARIVQKGFEETQKEMDARFDEVDARFKEVDARFNEINRRFLKVYDKLAEASQERKEIRKRLDILEKGQQLILAKLEKMVFRDEFEKLESRVKVLEEALVKR